MGWACARPGGGRLRYEYLEQKAHWVSHEAIYTWIYALSTGELARQGIPVGQDDQLAVGSRPVARIFGGRSHLTLQEQPSRRSTRD